MGTIRSVGIIAAAIAATLTVPVLAQRQIPKHPAPPRPPRPPAPRGNDLLLGSAVTGGVFAITASVSPVHVAPGYESGPRRGPRSLHPRHDVGAHR